MTVWGRFALAATCLDMALSRTGAAGNGMRSLMDRFWSLPQTQDVAEWEENVQDASPGDLQDVRVLADRLVSAPVAETLLQMILDTRHIVTDTFYEDSGADVSMKPTCEFSRLRASLTSTCRQLPASGPFSVPRISAA